MKLFFWCLILATLLASPVRADWPTTSFAPIPFNPSKSYKDIIGDNFDDFVESSGSPLALTPPGQVEGLDFGVLRAGAVSSLAEVMRGVSLNAQALRDAGFPAPVFVPMLTDTKVGASFYPIFWTDVGLKPTNIFAQGCVGGTPNKVILANVANYPYTKLQSAWNAGDLWRKRMLRVMVSQLTHELVHAIQVSTFQPDCEANLWFKEATADALAFYLTARQFPDLYVTYPKTQDLRPYSDQLYKVWYAYESGSFFRYLLEASEANAKPDLSILLQLTKLSPSAVTTEDNILQEVNAAVKAHSGGRTLFQVLPEFFTEFASYSQRYSAFDRRYVDKDKAWLAKAFPGCTTYQLTPGQTLVQTIQIDELAAACVSVEWSGFSAPVALQFFIKDGAGVALGDLHLGEAVRTDAGEITKRCYDATQGLSRRIALKMEQKCMLRRGQLKERHGQNGWTSDFNTTGAGNAYFILSNVPKDLDDARPQSVNLFIGTLEAKATGGATGGAALQPRRPQPGSAVKDGLTSIDSRVHAISGAEDRSLVDGRSAFDDGVEVGFLGDMPGASPGSGVMSIVRGGEYWVGFMGQGPDGKLKDSAIIFKDADALMNGGNIMDGATMSLGLTGVSFGAGCGYEVPATFTMIEQTPAKLTFRATGDLFRMSRKLLMGGGGGASSICGLLDKAHVEHADFTVSLPNGDLYRGDVGVTRLQTPGQELYDDVEFRAGPSFGGIDTSLSLAGFGTGGTADPGAPPDKSPAGPGGKSSAVGTDLCTCGCPNTAAPSIGACRAQCLPIWLSCPLPSSAPPDAEPVRDFLSALQGKGLPPDIERMLTEDFSTMSGETQARLYELVQTPQR